MRPHEVRSIPLDSPLYSEAVERLRSAYVMAHFEPCDVHAELMRHELGLFCKVYVAPSSTRYPRSAGYTIAVEPTNEETAPAAIVELLDQLAGDFVRRERP